MSGKIFTGSSAGGTASFSLTLDIADECDAIVRTQVSTVTEGRLLCTVLLTRKEEFLVFQEDRWGGEEPQCMMDNY